MSERTTERLEPIGTHARPGVRAASLTQRAPMTKTIVCATDFSPAADKTIHLAQRLARLLGDRLELVHRVPRSPFIHPEMVSAALGPLQEAARSAMRACTD